MIYVSSLFLWLFFIIKTNSFRLTNSKVLIRNPNLVTTVKCSSSDSNEEYRNIGTKLLGNFLKKSTEENQKIINLDSINWSVAKRKKTSLEILAKSLEQSLSQREWFVTGNVDPSYFSDQFKFQDPDVKLTGIENYARGVNKIFSQDSRAEIVSITIHPYQLNTLTVIWRLSGQVRIGFGLTLKPFLVYTDFTIDSNTGLIVFQEDRFSLPGYDIVLSALFPFLWTNLNILDPACPSINELEKNKSTFNPYDKKK